MYRQRKPEFKLPRGTKCPFCENKVEIDYKDTGTLNKFISERGKMIGKNRTGVCSTHQRALTIAIKLARHVALLPFVERA